MRPAESDPWPRRLAAHGFPGARRIGAGTEGTVYAIGGGRVAKVWTGPPPSPAARRMYAELAGRELPFATPEILGLREIDGAAVTVERELPGVPMRGDSAHEEFPRELPAGQLDALLVVVRGLASVPATAALKELAFQGDDRPLWQGHRRFPDALAALVERASARSGGRFAEFLPGAEAAAARTAAALRSLPDAAPTVIHGDLVPPNIHVDEDGRPVAVLDFGFCTTAGDPAFEAAVTAAVWDMYGPHAAAHTAELSGLFARELGFPEEVLAVYRAAYALVTFDLFGMGEEDGHVRWCARLLGTGTQHRY